MIEDRGSETTTAISDKTRWLAITAGSVAFGTTLVLGWPSLVESGFLVLSAIVQPRSTLPGRWLMWVSALLLSVMALPLGAEMLVGGVKALRSFHDNAVIGTFSLSALSVLLVLWCDVALIMDGVTVKRSRDGLVRPSRRSLDWVVWIAALALTGYYLSTTVLAMRPYRLYGRRGPLATGVALTLVVLLLDIALLVEAVQHRGAMQVRKT